MHACAALLAVFAWCRAVRAAAADDGRCRDWTSWGDFLGTGSVATKDMVFLPYEEAQRVAQGLGIKGSEEYYERYTEAEGLPSNPDQTYKG